MIALCADFLTTLHILHGLGLSIDFIKCKLTHFTRKHDIVFPTITLPSPDGDVTITHHGTMKWLGIMFNSKLLFNEHIKMATNKVENIAKGLTMLGNTVQGLHQLCLLHTIYSICVWSIMTYASPVWWDGKKKHANKLTWVQNTCLCHIRVAFCTTVMTVTSDHPVPYCPIASTRSPSVYSMYSPFPFLSICLVAPPIGEHIV